MGRECSGSPTAEDRESLCVCLHWGCPKGITYWGRRVRTRPGYGPAREEQHVIQEEAGAEPQRLGKDKEPAVLQEQGPRSLL